MLREPRNVILFSHNPRQRLSDIGRNEKTKLVNLCQSTSQQDLRKNRIPVMALHGLLILRSDRLFGFLDGRLYSFMHIVDRQIEPALVDGSLGGIQAD